MINFHLTLRNPWAKNDFDNLHCHYTRLSENKTVTFEIVHYKPMLLTIEVGIAWRGSDHAGPNIELGLFGYSISIQLHDNRHWNYEDNCWGKHD